MLLKVRRGWEIRESLVTPESVYRDRRRFLGGLAAGTLAAALPSKRVLANDAPPSLYPAKRNDAYGVGDRAITPENTVTTYNNFYEFGMSKTIADDAQALKTSPWTIKIDGMVDAERTIELDDLIKQMPLEERVYRHRCVEGWSFVAPWTGFPLKSLVDFAKPKSDAKYLKMETFEAPEIAHGQLQFWYPWPYVEGLTMAEATNELAFLVTGMYGKPLPKQDGAPLRLATPWKYGFKSIKSIVRFNFTDERPTSYWQSLQSSEYGFWANVNPEVPHPRWSQADERDLGTGDRRPTLLFNGYADQVAGLYKDLQSEKLYM